MGKPYSDDLRERVVGAMATGRSCRDVGSAFAVAPSTAGNWYRLHRRMRSHAARPMGGDRRSKLLGQADWIAARLAQASELTLGEVRDDLAGSGIVVSYASVWRMVRRPGLRHKKDHLRDRAGSARCRHRPRHLARGAGYPINVIL